MDRSGRLSYARLVASLERLSASVSVKFPQAKDTGRARDLQQAIKDTLADAHAGAQGAPIAPPVQLKRKLEARIAAIHNQHDSSPTDADPATSMRAPSNSEKENSTPPTVPTCAVPRRVSAVKKTTITARPTRSTTGAGVKKRASRSKPPIQAKHLTRSTASDEADRQAAAEALLELASSPYTSFSSSVSSSFTSSHSSQIFFTPSTGSGSDSLKRKRDTDTSDDIPSTLDTGSQTTAPHHHHANNADSSPAAKKRMLFMPPYAPLPSLAVATSAHQSFALGIGYAVQHFTALQTTTGGEELKTWVTTQLDMRESQRTNGTSQLHKRCAIDAQAEMRESQYAIDGLHSYKQCGNGSPTEMRESQHIGGASQLFGQGAVYSRAGCAISVPAQDGEVVPEDTARGGSVRKGFWDVV